MPPAGKQRDNNIGLPLSMCPSVRSDVVHTVHLDWVIGCGPNLYHRCCKDSATAGVSFGGQGSSQVYKNAKSLCTRNLKTGFEFCTC